nr:unnamed protein product [Ipomoea batatas]
MDEEAGCTNLTDRLGHLNMHGRVAAGAFVLPTLVICNASPTSEALSICCIFFLRLYLHTQTIRNANRTNSANPPTTDPTMIPTFLDFLPSELGACACFGAPAGGGGGGNTGAGEGAMDSTTIEKWPCWNVVHMLLDNTLLKLTEPFKSIETHFAVDPPGTDFTSGNLIEMGLSDAVIFHSCKFVADRGHFPRIPPQFWVVDQMLDKHSLGEVHPETVQLPEQNQDN